MLTCHLDRGSQSVFEIILDCSLAAGRVLEEPGFNQYGSASRGRGHVLIGKSIGKSQAPDMQNEAATRVCLLFPSQQTGCLGEADKSIACRALFLAVLH